jgi:hypothetical protein
VKVKYNLLEDQLRSCAKCGKDKRCRINGNNEHDNDITHQMVMMWAQAWVCLTFCVQSRDSLLLGQCS